MLYYNNININNQVPREDFSNQEAKKRETDSRFKYILANYNLLNKNYKESYELYKEQISTNKNDQEILEIISNNILHNINRSLQSELTDNKDFDHIYNNLFLAYSINNKNDVIKGCFYYWRYLKFENKIQEDPSSLRHFFSVNKTSLESSLNSLDDIGKRLRLRNAIVHFPNAILPRYFLSRMFKDKNKFGSELKQLKQIIINYEAIYKDHYNYDTNKIYLYAKSRVSEIKRLTK